LNDRAKEWLLIMVESKLFRVPRGETAEPVSLFQVNVEIDLSTNPKVCTMFTDAEVGKEMDAFFKANGIRMESKYAKGTTVTAIELRGSPEGLAKFVETYLADDNSPVVYNLNFR
jgi:hypothetical protein